jgi:hypothetical protein
MIFFLKLIIWNIDIHTCLLDSTFLYPHLFELQNTVYTLVETTLINNLMRGNFCLYLQQTKGFWYTILYGWNEVALGFCIDEREHAGVCMLCMCPL